MNMVMNLRAPSKQEIPLLADSLSTAMFSRKSVLHEDRGLHLEVGGSKALGIVGVLTRYYTASQPRRQRYVSSSP
jgi:hypothetical protein